jgi:hypothetical protein
MTAAATRHQSQIRPVRTDLKQGHGRGIDGPEVNEPLRELQHVRCFYRGAACPRRPQ